MVLGMPGTGKTFVILFLLKIFLDNGNQILLSSYTHSAIDNILKRFVEKYPAEKEKIVRLASNPNQVDESLRDLVYQRKKFNKVKELDEYFGKKQIFACTCLATKNLLLSMNFV